MNNIVTITIFRHSKSIANEYLEKYGSCPQDEKFRNARLSEKGINDINSKKSYMNNYIKKNLGDPDFIFLSPLKRAIQTGLLVLEDQYIPYNKIWLVPIVSERGNIIENKGISRSDMITDNDLINLKKFKLISLNNDPETLFYYNNGWKTKFLNGWELDNSKMISIQNITTWINLNDKLNILSDKEKRKNAFFDMISNIKFSGKKILIFSHYVFINTILGKKPNNLAGYTFTFNQTTGEIKIINKFDPSQLGGEYYEKYLKYKSKYLNYKNSQD